MLKASLALLVLLWTSCPVFAFESQFLLQTGLTTQSSLRTDVNKIFSFEISREQYASSFDYLTGAVQDLSCVDAVDRENYRTGFSLSSDAQWLLYQLWQSDRVRLANLRTRQCIDLGSDFLLEGEIISMYEWVPKTSKAIVSVSNYSAKYWRFVLLDVTTGQAEEMLRDPNLNSRKRARTDPEGRYVFWIDDSSIQSIRPQSYLIAEKKLISYVIESDQYTPNQGNLVARLRSDGLMALFGDSSKSQGGSVVSTRVMAVVDPHEGTVIAHWSPLEDTWIEKHLGGKGLAILTPEGKAAMLYLQSEGIDSSGLTAVSLYQRVLGERYSYGLVPNGNDYWPFTFHVNAFLTQMPRGDRLMMGGRYYDYRAGKDFNAILEGPVSNPSAMKVIGTLPEAPRWAVCINVSCDFIFEGDSNKLYLVRR